MEISDLKQKYLEYIKKCFAILSDKNLEKVEITESKNNVYSLRQKAKLISKTESLKKAYDESELPLPDTVGRRLDFETPEEEIMTNFIYISLDAILLNNSEVDRELKKNNWYYKWKHILKVTIQIFEDYSTYNNFYQKLILQYIYCAFCFRYVKVDEVLDLYTLAGNPSIDDFVIPDRYHKFMRMVWSSNRVINTVKRVVDEVLSDDVNADDISKILSEILENQIIHKIYLGALGNN
jgi:hypothetical protein